MTKMTLHFRYNPSAISLALLLIGFCLVFGSCATIDDKVHVASQRRDVKYIIDILQNSNDRHARSVAAKELGSYTASKETVIPILISALGDTAVEGGYSSTVVWENPNTGEEMGSPYTTWAPQRYPVRGAALESLKSLTGQDFGMDKSKWLEWWEKDKRSLRKKDE
jgi:hypothetical protein